MLKIEVNNLILRSHHGVFEQERAVGNDFSVSVALSVESAIDDLESDEIGSTINYADVVDIIKLVMVQPCNLLETVCHRLATTLQSTYPQVVSGEVRIAKLTPPIPGVKLDSVAVTIAW